MESSDIIEDTTLVSKKPLDSVIPESVKPEDGTQYRLRIKNVPKFASSKMMKELLAKNGCEQVKIQKAPKWDYCFATLKTEEQQYYVLNKLKGIKFKNRELSIQVDNVTEKDRQALFDRRKNEKQQNIEQSGIQKSPEEMLADQVTPLHIYEYQAQLEIKQRGIIKSLETFRDKMDELYNKSQYHSSWLQE
ncbi:14763_t:CDS:1, partial [Rhizophagus irregularis]